MASGQAMSAKGDHRAAVIQFKTALQKDPNSGEARYELGKALLAASDPVAAALELSKALDQKVDATKVVPPLARAYLLTGEFKKITGNFGTLVLGDKTAQASLKTSVATAWAAQGSREQTEAALAAALQAGPDFPPALVLQARIAAGKGAFDEAEALLDRALKADDKLFDGWHLRGEILAFGKSDAPGAVAMYQRALQAEPTYLPAHMALMADRLQARDLAGAKAQAAQMRKVLPRHPQTIFVEAQLAYGERNFKKARELLQVLLKGTSDNAHILQLAGAVESQLGTLALAESYFGKALQLQPRLGVARRGLGRVYLRAGQPQKALETLSPIAGPDSNDADALALVGEAQLRLGNGSAAEAAFRKAASLAPDDLRLRTTLALSNLGRSDPNAVFSELEEIATRSQKDTFADQAIISARIRRNELDLALKAADALVKKVPTQASALELRGRLQVSRNDYAAARKDFNEALRLDPALFSATVSLADLDQLEKKPDQARQRLADSLKADPANHFARVALAGLRIKERAPADEVKDLIAQGVKLSPLEPGLRLMQVELLIGYRQFKEALAAAQEASAALPGEPRVLDALGRAQMEAGDVEQAVSTFRRLIDAEPRSMVAYLRLADVYRATKRLPAAENILRKALEADPRSAPVQEALASLLLTTNRPAEAIAVARQMQTQRPQLAAGYLLEAGIHLQGKQLTPALEAYRRGLATPSPDAQLARQYFLALHGNGQTAEAERFGATWMKAHPDDLLFDYQLAVAAIQRRDYAQAEARLTNIVKAKPQFPAAFNNLAWVLASRGKPGGIELAQRALELAPDRPEYLDTLALALHVDKQAAKALEIQKRVVQLRPNEPGYRLSLARMAIDAGDKATAKAELERLKALGSTYPQQAEVSALAQKL